MTAFFVFMMKKAILFQVRINLTRIKTFVCALSVWMVSSTAMANEMDILFGNTIVLTTITQQSEVTVQLYYNPDGTVGTDTDDVYTWVKRGSDVCTTFKLEDGEKYETCTPLSELKGAGPGSSWEDKPSPKVTILRKLKPGR